MNICFLSYRENNPYIGGIENVTYLLCKSFIKRGHNVICVSQINTQKCHYTPACEEFFFPEAKSLNNEINTQFLISIIDKYDINIIINQNSINKQSIILCEKIKERFPKKKIITPLHFDLFYEQKAIVNNFFIKIKNGSRLSSWIKDLLFFSKYHLYKKYEIAQSVKDKLKDIAQVSDYIVFLSQGAKEEANKLLGGKEKNKFTVIGNPIDINNCNYHKNKEILYVGRIEFGLKRFDRMLYIWKKLEKRNPGWKLIVLGDGGYRELFENKAKEMGLTRICFEGFKDPTEYYRTASIVCLTSSSEGFGKVLAEAQSYACVPIAFDSFTAINDIISNGENGYCIKAFNKHLFAKQLQELINDRENIKIIGEQAKKDSLQFSLETIAEKWENLFNKISYTQ